MLVLTRKEKQRIIISDQIGNQIIVTLVCIMGDRARIAVEAPGEISIDREEVYQRKLAEQAALDPEAAADP